MLVLPRRLPSSARTCADETEPAIKPLLFSEMPRAEDAAAAAAAGVAAKGVVSGLESLRAAAARAVVMLRTEAEECSPPFGEKGPLTAC